MECSDVEEVLFSADSSLLAVLTMGVVQWYSYGVSEQASSSIHLVMAGSKLTQFWRSLQSPAARRHVLAELEGRTGPSRSVCSLHSSYRATARGRRER